MSDHAPSLTAAEMASIDRWMIDEVGVDLMQMMENAGRLLARLARLRFLAGRPEGKAVLVLAGAGGNGGGALAAARNLANWGARVSVFLARPETEVSGAPARQIRALRWASVPLGPMDHLPEDPRANLVVDGMIGYSLRGDLRGSILDAVGWANGQRAPVLSLDVPTGVDPTTGEVRPTAVQAAATLTLALPKTGLQREPGRTHAGELYLADIGVPPALYARLDPPRGAAVFGRGDLVRLDPETLAIQSLPSAP